MPSPRTLDELFTQYHADYLHDKAPHTQYQQQKFFAQVLREVGNLPLNEVTSDVLRAWKARLSVRNKPATVRKYMGRLSAVLTAAVEDYAWITTHPLKRIRKPSAGKGVVRFLLPDERVALLTACRASANPALYPLVVLALSTGGRKNEIRRLHWTEVDLNSTTGVVRFLATKNGESRSLPLLGEGLALMQTWAAERVAGIPWVFPNDTGRAPRPMESAWRTALKRSGVPCFRFHDLRHTFGSYLAMSGASLADIKELLGHKNIQQTMVYVHLMPSHTRVVVERMLHKFLLPSDPTPCPRIAAPSCVACGAASPWPC